MRTCSPCFAGVNIYAAIFLIPFSVVLYTCTGGLKVSLKVTAIPCNGGSVPVGMLCCQKPLDNFFTCDKLQFPLKGLERQNGLPMSPAEPQRPGTTMTDRDFAVVYLRVILCPHSDHLHCPAHILVKHFHLPWQRKKGILLLLPLLLISSSDCHLP